MDKLCCNNCNHPISSHEDLAFYKESETQVHLITKPERNETVKHLETRVKEKKNKLFPIKVFCPKCNGPEGIGSVSASDPKRYHWEQDKVHLSEDYDPRKQKWIAILKDFPNIEQRTSPVPVNIVKSESDGRYGYFILCNERRHDPVILSKGDETIELISSLTVHSPRKYQVEMFLKSVLRNTIVYLPTGAGKTLVAAMLIKRMKDLNPKKKVLFLVNTVHLVIQQGDFIASQTQLKVGKYYGDNWDKSEVKELNALDCLVLTAGLCDQLLGKEIFNISDFSLLVIDEVHHTVGNHPCHMVVKNFLLKTPLQMRPLVLGLSASPATDEKKLTDLCKILDAIVQTPMESESVKQLEEHVFKPQLEWKQYYENPQETALNQAIEEHLSKCRLNLKTKMEIPNVKDSTYLEELRTMYDTTQGGDRLILLHMLQIHNLLAVNGILGPKACCQKLEHYFEDLSSSPPDSERGSMYKMCGNIYHNSTLEKIGKQLAKEGKHSVRTEVLLNTLGNDSVNSRVIVFVRTRESAWQLCDLLKKNLKHLKAEIFVGQRGNRGMSPDDQQRVRMEFEDGRVNVLVATSVLEEGADIPACNLCICFDGLRSLRELIQIRGRARHKESKFLVLGTAEQRNVIDLLLDQEQGMNRLIKKKFHNEEPHPILKEWIVKPEHTSTFFIGANKEFPIDGKHIQRVETHTKDSVLFQLQLPEGQTPLNFFATEKDSLLDVFFHWNQPFERKPNITTALTGTEIWVGSFWNLEKFCWGWSRCAPFPISLQGEDHSISFQLETLDVRIPYRFIQGSVLLVVSQPSKSHLYIPVKYPAQVYQNSVRFASQLENSLTDAFDFANGLVYCLGFSLDENGIRQLHNNLSILEHFGIPVYYRMTDFKFEQHIPYPSPSEFELECLLSQFGRYRFPPTFCSQLLQTKNWKEVVEELTQGLFLNPFLDVLDFISKVEPLESRLTTPVLDNHETIKQIYVTPLRLIIHGEVQIPSNRMLRTFGSHQFIRVNFVDEDFQRLNEMSASVSMRMRQVFETSISVGGTKYSYIGYSNSGLKQSAFWFMNSTFDFNQVWQQMGDFSHIKCVATYGARLAQCFTSSIDIGKVEYDEIEDICSSGPECKYTFTDGIGSFNNEFGKELSKRLPKEKTSFTAVQVRLGGFKGVIALYPHGPRLGLRSSMKKFQSSHSSLEVASVAHFNQGYLNRQVILLLEERGVSRQVFLQLQQKHLVRMAGILTDAKKAKAALRTCLLDKMTMETDVLREPFFLDLLRNLYRSQLRQLICKSKILVPESQVMMGVVDESKTLEYGQVFLKSSKHGVIKGKKVVVAKNPCLHPGDILVLDAVDVPGLHHTLDVLVFPAKGPRPHPNECSGSDLDGDMYLVIWREELIPVKSFDPMDYSAAEKQEHPQPIQKRDVINFVVEFVSSQSADVGRISNAHLAQADMNGVDNEICLYLAQQFSVAVDYPKTGVAPVIPDDYIPKKYPSFMQIKTKDSYDSIQVLGKLYEQCIMLGDLVEIIPTVEKDPRFQKPGHGNYITDANKLFREYSIGVRRLLRLYSLSREADLITSYSNSTVSKRDMAYHHDWLNLQQLYRMEFFREFGGESVLHSRSPDDISKLQQKAVAWYCAAYEFKSTNKGDPMQRILSFPWIVGDVLSSLQGPSPNIPADKFYEDVTSSIMEQLKPYTQRLNMRSNVEKILKEKFEDASVQMFGSSLLLLFGDSSDVDLCVSGKGVQLEDVYNWIKISVPECELISSAKVPIIRTTNSTEFSFDITLDTSGLSKSLTLLHLIRNKPELLPLLFVVVSFGRRIGLCGSKLALPASQIVEVFVSHYLQKDNNSSYPSDIQPFNIEELKILCKGPPFPMVEPLLKFFLFGSEHNWGTEEDVLVHQKFLRGYHSLALAGDLTSFFAYVSNQSEREIRVGSHTTKYLHSTVGEIVGCIQQQTGAIAKAIPGKNSSLVFWLKGELSQLRAAEDFIRGMVSHYKKLPPRSSKTFVEGANVLLVEGSDNGSDSLSFEMYNGNYNPQHSIHTRHSIYVIKDKPASLDLQYNKFRKALKTQLQLIQNNYQSSLYGKIKVSIRFGRFYLVHVPLSMLETVDPVSIDQLESAMKQRLKGKKLMSTPSGAFYEDFLEPWGKKAETKGQQARPVKAKKFTTQEQVPRRTIYSEISEKQRDLATKGLERVQPNEYYSLSAVVGTKELKIRVMMNSGKQQYRYSRHRALKWFSSDLLGMKKTDVRFSVESEQGLDEMSELKFATKVTQKPLLTSLDNEMTVNPGSDMYDSSYDQEYDQVYMLRHIQIEKFVDGDVTVILKNVNQQDFVEGSDKPVRNHHFELELKLPTPKDWKWSEDFPMKYWQTGIKWMQKLTTFQ